MLVAVVVAVLAALLIWRTPPEQLVELVRAVGDIVRALSPGAAP